MYNSDIKERSINKYFIKIKFIYNDVLCNSTSINNLIYRICSFSLFKLLNLYNYIPNCNVIKIKNSEINNYLNNGFVIIKCFNLYACEVKEGIERGVCNSSELSIGGGKDSFDENINTNLGLIRRRIKNNLNSIDLNIGCNSNTKVNVLFVKGICKKSLVSNIINRLKNIHIDGILDSSYLKYALENSHNLFPTIIMSERPDKCSMALLEGKVIVLVDNSCYALILPSFFIDFFHTTDDYYQKSFNTTFIRVIRLISFFIAILTPSIYICVTTRNYSLIPLDLLLTLKAGRSFVPFPAYIEALFMIVCFEILKESDLRMSATSGSSISILGGLILGDAAVSASIVSPIMIIVIAISSIAGLIFNNFEFVNVIRIYKIIILLFSTLFGIYGLLIGLGILLIDLITLKVFDYHYLSFDKNEIKDSFIKIDDKMRKRNSILTNNIYRGSYK